MPSSQERIAVLNMIQQGTITAEQGLELLYALDEKQVEKSSRSPVPPAEKAHSGHWFRVKVSDVDSGRVRVNIRLPVSVLSAGMKMGARFSPEIEGLDTERLLNLIHSTQVGKIVDAVDEKDGEHIEITIE